MESSQLEGLGEKGLRALVEKLNLANEAFAEREEKYKKEVERLQRESGIGIRASGDENSITQGEAIPLAAVGEVPRARKDMTLQSMVGTWSGEDSVPVTEFLEGVELVAQSGHWDDKDKALVIRMRLKGAAAAFLASRSDLRRPETSYRNLKEALEIRFKDHSKPEHYLLRLSSVAQSPTEGIGPFADRCRAIGEKAQREEGTALEQAAARRQIEQVVLAAFLRGLRGEVGRFLRLNPPGSLEEAVQKAVMAEREYGSASQSCFVAQTDSPQAMNRTELDPSQQIGSIALECYRCGGKGHMARVCATPRLQGKANAVPVKSVGAPLGPCFSCGRRGHFARNCRERDSSQRAPKGSGPAAPRYPVRN